MVSKRSVLITGCSDGGIGSALALAFSRRDFCVYATARQVENMKELQTQENITLLPLDILNPNQIKEVVDIVEKNTGGTLDYFFNNAGRVRFMPLLDEDIEEAQKIFETNTWAPLRLVQAFSPLLIKSRGTIVFNTSGSGYLNVPWQGTFAASKRSLEILGDNLRVELAPFHVKVVSIVTGAVMSKTHTHYEDWKMPRTSRYLAVEKSYTKRAKGDDGAPRMDAHKYAEGVVGKLLKNPGAKFWYGGAAGVVKFAVSWFPTSWLDNGLARGTGIDIMLKDKQ
ncbi:putative hydroxybutyrate dehydrogenase [Amniculicola lignicola CBS 123094]|uniref:Putative hydroxybutyrate dehydrogenase n=1 Tax=Amniculicola lignicola CBS 123094 TaxID=1392246 RepID=A0A6A5VVS4_9PLEO|nr:putative hydroxybutyrate dehydrogenase [Amniculicola lignicola CBS 123094]